MRPSVTQDRNRHEWRAIAEFLVGVEALARPIECKPEMAADAATGKRSAGAAAAGFRSIPDGNHGDNRGSIK